jgi:hypothetical protein
MPYLIQESVQGAAVLPGPKLAFQLSIPKHVVNFLNFIGIPASAEWMTHQLGIIFPPYLIRLGFVPGGAQINGPLCT